MIRHIQTLENLGLGLVNFQTAALNLQVLKSYGTFQIADYHKTRAEIPVEARQGAGIPITPITWEDGKLIVPSEIELGALPIGTTYPAVTFYLGGSSEALEQLLCSFAGGPGFPINPQNGRNVLRIPNGILFRI